MGNKKMLLAAKAAAVAESEPPMSPTKDLLAWAAALKDNPSWLKDLKKEKKK